MLKLLAKEIDEVRIQQIREYFQALDRHKDGFLTRDELLRGIQKYWGLENLRAEDISAVLPDAVGDRIAPAAGTKANQNKIKQTRCS